MKKEKGYVVREYKNPIKRYCQTMDLKDDPELVAEYIKRHSEAEAWPEIYILGTRLFMIVETPLDFDWVTAMAKLATLPRQAEWEEYMSIFQKADPKASSAEKWQLMERIFYLYE